MQVLIVKLSSLGDILHALPAVHAMRKGLDARIDWATQSEYAELVGCFPDVERVIPVERRRPWRGGAKTLRRLRAKRYDLVVDLQGLLKSALISGLARGDRRLGPSFHREGSRWFYHAVPALRDRSRHAVEQNLDVLDLLGLPRPEKMIFPVAFPRYELRTGRPRIGLAPVSRWPSKNWPEANFSELADMLHDRYGASIVLLGGASDRELCRRIAERCRVPPINLCGKLSLPELGGCIENLDLLVSNDSGPVHIAAALDRPCLVFYGPTAPGRTGPWGERHTVLIPKGDCTGCYRRVCRRKHGHCLETLSPGNVMDTIRRKGYLETR